MTPVINRLCTAVAFVLSVCLASRLLGGDNAGADLAGQWQQAQAALEQRDFKAATVLLVSIEQAAMQEREWGHAARAIAQRVELEVATNEMSSGSSALKLKDAASRAPLPMRAVLEVLAARRFRSYAEHLFGGQECDVPVVEGIPQQPEGLLNEIEQCYRRAMAFEEVLKRIPVEMYGALFDEGTVADALRPTLFDLIAYDLLEFYAWCRERKFDDTESVTLDPDGPALQDVAGFSLVIPDEAARRSRVLRALRLWQTLLAFHVDDKDPAAYADADLNRLQFCYPLVAGEKREERYCAALDRFAHKWRTHELSSRAFALRAQLAFDAGDAALAHVVAQKGASAYPASIGAAQCRNLIARIEEPSLALASERVWCAPWPQFEIAYKNLTQLHFRAVRVPFDEAFVPRRTRRSAEDATPLQWLARKPLKQWGVALPRVGDYRVHSHRTSVPQDFPNGLYALFVSPDASFEAGGAPIMWETFRVSRLALVVDQKPDRVHGYVLTAREGEPVPAARVTAWRKQVEGGFKRERMMMTAEDGGFAVLGGRAGEIMILAERQDDAAQTWMPLWKGNARMRFEAPVTCAAFVTDRDVYRPGQTLRYRGFFWKDDPAAHSVYAAAGLRVKIAGVDASDRRLAGREVACTPFGSCSGEMVIPDDTPPGLFTLAAEGIGSTSVQVEAADPSALDVTLALPPPGARLGDVLTVSGRAVRDGAAVPGARVSWRVAWHREGADPCMAAPLAAGSTVSDTQGVYTVTFFAKAPPQREEADPAACVFTVTVEATAADGGSGRADLPVVLGETAWLAQIAVDAWQTVSQPVRFEVGVQALDGTAIITPGKLRIVQLKPSEWVKRSPLPLLDDSASGVCRVDDGEDPVEAWPEMRTLGEERVQTGTNGAASGLVPLPVGVFRLTYETRDPAGRRVTARRNVRVLDPDARCLPFTVPVHVAAESWRVPAGDRFRAVWGSGYARASALMLAESDGFELLRMRTDPEVTQQWFELPVDTAARGGFWFRTLCVRENRAYTYERRVEVVRRDQNLSLAVEGLPPAGCPGERITCTVKVTGPDGAGCAAELLALLSTEDVPAISAWWETDNDNQTGACTTNVGFQFQNHGVQLAQLCGSWRDDREPDTWRYRTWRTYDIDPPKDDAQSDAEHVRIPTMPIQETSVDGTAGARRAAVCTPRFFLPQAVSDSEGSVTLSFTVPEAPGRWRLSLFAHDARLRCGRLDLSL